MWDAWCPWELAAQRERGRCACSWRTRWKCHFYKATSSKGHGKQQWLAVSPRSLANVLPSICIFYLFLYPFLGRRHRRSFPFLSFPWLDSFAPSPWHLSPDPPLVARPWIFRVCPVLLRFGTHILLSSKVDKGFGPGKEGLPVIL